MSGIIPLVPRSRVIGLIQVMCGIIDPQPIPLPSNDELPSSPLEDIMAIPIDDLMGNEI